MKAKSFLIIIWLGIVGAVVYAVPFDAEGDMPERFIPGRIPDSAWVQPFEEPKIRTSHACIKVTTGETGWRNRHNRKFYNWLFRYAPFVLTQQREFCGINDCQDLEFLSDFFQYNPFPNNRLVPDDFIQRHPYEVAPRNVLLVGAHPREVDWLLVNSPSGKIFAIDHAKEAVKALQNMAEKRRWPKSRVRIRRLSILSSELKNELRTMNDGEAPHLHFVFAMWSAFYEFNPEEQGRFLKTVYDLLPSPGGLVIDFLSDPMSRPDPIGYKRVQIDLEGLGLSEQMVKILREKHPPPALNVYIPGRTLFMDMVNAAGFDAHSSFQDTQTPTFLYNEARQSRALYLFERRDRK